MTKIGKGLVIVNLFLSLCFLGAAVMVMSSRVDSQSKITAAKKEYGELSTRRAAAEEATLTLTDQLSAVEKKIEQTESSNKDALASGMGDLETAQKEITSMITKQQELQKQMGETTTAQAEIRSKVVDLHADLAKMAEETQSLEASRLALEDELAKAEIGRQAAETRNDQLAKRVESLKKIVGTTP